MLSRRMLCRTLRHAALGSLAGAALANLQKHVLNQGINTCAMLHEANFAAETEAAQVSIA